MGTDVVYLFKHKTAYDVRISGWSSDVCSSALLGEPAHRAQLRRLVEIDHHIAAEDRIERAAHIPVRVEQVQRMEVDDRHQLRDHATVTVVVAGAAPEVATQQRLVELRDTSERIETACGGPQYLPVAVGRDDRRTEEQRDGE